MVEYCFGYRGGDWKRGGRAEAIIHFRYGEGREDAGFRTAQGLGGRGGVSVGARGRAMKLIGLLAASEMVSGG